jgi:hypothetical protein
MPSFEEVLAKASPSTGSVRLLVGGALVGQIRELERQLGAAPAPQSLGEVSPARLLAEQITTLQEQMRDSEVEFRLRAMGGRAWEALKTVQPTREKDEASEAFAARWFDWMALLVSRTCVDPLMSAEQVAQLADQMPGSSWDELTAECWGLNAGKVSIPFSAAAFALTQVSEPTSRRPPNSASRPAGSSAKSAPKRPRTSTTKPAA